MSVISPISAGALRRALTLRDLADPAQGPHAIQLLVNDVAGALATSSGCALRVRRDVPIVELEHNYDALFYAPDAIARDARYTRYINDRVVLRTHTTSMIPGLLSELAAAPPADVLLVCPGIVYRRDAIDRLHTGEPHQLDLWRITRSKRLATADLLEMIAQVVTALLPGARHRTTPAVHPYTECGLQIDVESSSGWVEIGECGLALPALLERRGLPARDYSGLAMGLGLDRIFMLRKGIDDIRLLRSADPRVLAQMQDLTPYRSVSRQPATTRDLSIVVGEHDPVETLGDRVRLSLGDDAASVETVELRAETAHSDLPEHVRARLGILPGQKNVLVRVVLRNLERSLTHVEANDLRNRIYTALHQGSRSELAV
jgi:phenylalanyl-tRNA synthetase alpha chain